MSYRFRAVAFIVAAIFLLSATAAYLFRSRLDWLPYVGFAVGSARPAASGQEHPQEHANVPAPPGGAETTARGEITIDSRRQQLIGVQIVTAKRTAIAPTIRAVGAVRSDETRLTDVNVKLEGWIRDLYVDYTGQPVATGQPLFTLYSPDLLATESEYLLALKTRDQVQQSLIADAR